MSCLSIGLKLIESPSSQVLWDVLTLERCTHRSFNSSVWQTFLRHSHLGAFFTDGMGNRRRNNRIKVTLNRQRDPHTHTHTLAGTRAGRAIYQLCYTQSIEGNGNCPWGKWTWPADGKMSSRPSTLNDPIESDVKGVDGNDASVISVFKHDERIREKGGRGWDEGSSQP